MHSIDILLATYNGEKFIKEQINSLLEQSYKDFQILVCDDNSIDSTLEILSEFIKNNPKKISLIRKPKNIPRGAMNTFVYLMSKSSAKYIMFCDQDDVWNQNKIETTLSEIKRQEATFGEKTPILVHSDLEIVNHALEQISPSFISSQKIIPESNFKNILIKNSATGCTIMINKVTLIGVGDFPEKAIMHDWWLVLYASAFGKVAYIDKPLIKYRQHANNVLGAKKSGLKNILTQSRKIYASLQKKESPLDKYVNQAISFQIKFKNIIPSQPSNDLNQFLHTFRLRNSIRRVFSYIRLDITKSRILDDLIMIALVALRKP